MFLTPIVLFTYKRPRHTQRILDSLSLNAEAKNSHLFRYNNGPKAGASVDALKNIRETRIIINNEKE